MPQLAPRHPWGMWRGSRAWGGDWQRMLVPLHRAFEERIFAREESCKAHDESCAELEPHESVVTKDGHWLEEMHPQTLSALRSPVRMGGGLGGRFPWPFKHSLQSILFQNQSKRKKKVFQFAF